MMKTNQLEREGLGELTASKSDSPLVDALHQHLKYYYQERSRLEHEEDFKRTGTGFKEVVHSDIRDK